TRQSAAATRQRAAAAVQRRGGIRGSGAGRSGERSFPSPGMYGLRESRCSKHRSERDSSNQRFHGISPPNAFTMSGFAHLLSSSNWGEKLLPSIKSRVGVRGISHCTVKVHPRPLYEQLRQLTTHVEHAPRESYTSAKIGVAAPRLNIGQDHGGPEPRALPLRPVSDRSTATRWLRAAIRQSAAAIIERSSVCRLGASRSGGRTYASPLGPRHALGESRSGGRTFASPLGPRHALGESRCSKHRSERDSSN